ncbi:hypothetical protein ACSSWA_09370 [Melioribacter sp. Ez-97]|uniref:hypothetical protein n=1 Tax=Melioribacter sp. Ez-97 TaxID=3423434 RepID=UPI003EDA9D15
MISKKSQYILLISTLLLIATYFVPIWKIDLSAPQYPEGIGLRIWLDKITGLNDYDLDNINKLNHYIGMKIIEPDSIPELKIMPFIVAFFIALGLIAFIMRRRIMIYLYVFLMAAVLLFGLYDFYKWEYDYGHNLNPDAPIKVPGMTYQPPLIGTKQLLNMRTTSLPDMGSYIIGLSISGFIGVLIYEKRFSG